MYALFQKNIVEKAFPFKAFIHSGTFHYPAHWHEEVEILFVLEGCLCLGIEDEKVMLNPGDIFIIGEHRVHSFLSPKDYIKSMIIRFNTNLFNYALDLNHGIYARQILQTRETQSTLWPIEAYSKSCKLLLSMTKEYQTPCEGYEFRILSQLYELLAVFIREVTPSKTPIESSDSNRSNLTQLEKVFRFVEENYSRDIYLDEAANVIGFSVHYFSVFFKKITGTTFNDYLNRYRTIKAEWYLLNSESTITEVAFICGFNNLNTFNRIFKKITGHTPSDFIKAAQAKNNLITK